MRRDERFRDVSGNRERLVWPQAAAAEPRQERFTLDVLHRDEIACRVIMPNFVHRADVRMVELRHRSCFPEQAAASFFGGGDEQFDRYEPIQTRVSRQKHCAHPAGAELTLDAVMTKLRPRFEAHNMWVRPVASIAARLSGYRAIGPSVNRVIGQSGN
jgi:hypothetical protein